MAYVVKAGRDKPEDLNISIEEVVVERKRDDRPDYVRVKYTDKKSNEVVGHTRVVILAD